MKPSHKVVGCVVVLALAGLLIWKPIAIHHYTRQWVKARDAFAITNSRDTNALMRPLEALKELGYLSTATIPVNMSSNDTRRLLEWADAMFWLTDRPHHYEIVEASDGVRLLVWDTDENFFNWCQGIRYFTLYRTTNQDVEANKRSELTVDPLRVSTETQP